MKVFRYPQDKAKIDRFFSRSVRPDLETEAEVRRIVERVRRHGDRAVVEFAHRFDAVRTTPRQFHVAPSRLKKAWQSLPANLQKALRTAHDRIRAYHKRQFLSGFTYVDALGNRMEQRVAPIRRVGVYAPGGIAAYPSTVLMDIVPARVAGVDQVVLITPPRSDFGGRAILGAAYLAGVDEVIAVGGAHGIAAAALGTESIERCDKIVGPGNKYVATAKRLLYGEIDIEMIAGPSEILVLADRTARPEIVAADLLSQAEHDPDAQAIAILIGEYDVAALRREIRRQTAATPRREIVAQSLRRNGAIVSVRNADDAVRLAEQKAPEHLVVVARGARSIAKRVRNAGAVFVGPWTPESMGDYVAGPNHTLPTGGTARFFSPLSVLSFLKTSHVVECSPRGFEKLADAVVTLAEAEGLTAHADAVRRRRRR
ncbi:histidinol dehydrogenase [Candidatus Sumerlaeota bacterium]|nr:histidinol dehydrogenase [Candidatus Sumerlaeota bacterium]